MATHGLMGEEGGASQPWWLQVLNDVLPSHNPSSLHEGFIMRLRWGMTRSLYRGLGSGHTQWRHITCILVVKGIQLSAANNSLN